MLINSFMFIPFFKTSMFSTVKVHNVSLQASERVIKEFFSFSGDIVHVEMQSGDKRSQFAYITFRDEQEAERAMLLTVRCLYLLTQSL